MSFDQSHLEVSFQLNFKNELLKPALTLQKNYFYLFQWKPFKMMKNAFYFILKALFILKIFKFLS